MTSHPNSRASPETAAPPAGYFLVVPPKDAEDDDAIDPVKLMQILRAHWILLVCLTFLGGALMAVISLQMRNQYKAQAVVAPTSEQNSGNSLKDEVGGIAELAGIDIGGGGGRKVEALATLMSPGLVRAFIVKNDLMPVLFSERWDPVAHHWRAGKKVPTLEQGVKRLRDKRTVTENTKSGLVTMNIEWYSPELAAKWTNDMIDMVNEQMREREIRTAHNSLDYLNRELATAIGVELRQAISRLMEKQINNEMLANVERDYAYHFIDPAIPPEIKDSPKRTMLSIGGAFLGLMLGFAYISLKRRFQRHKVALV